MLARSLRVASAYLSNQHRLRKFIVSARNVQISVVGAASDIGSNVALLLKLNSKVTRLHLYDENEKVTGLGMELAHVPGGAAISTFSDTRNLGRSLKGSQIILMTTRTARRPGRTREEMMADNALAVQSLCRTMVENNPNAFLAISTNPINSIIPFASALLCKYKCYNPCKVLGITHIDTARSRSLVGVNLQVNPRLLSLPVIGGHSDETIIPLFSNINPSCHSVNPCHADTLTRLVRKAGTEVIIQKQGSNAAILAEAWSIHEFINGLVDAVCGCEAVLNCFTVNPHFGTRFFAGPTSIGRNGIVQTCYDFPMNDYESFLLNAAVPVINRDVSKGEEHVRYLAELGNSW